MVTIMGGRRLESWCGLQPLHGNALASSSNAFLMSTHRELPECVRADDAKPLLMSDML